MTQIAQTHIDPIKMANQIMSNAAADASTILLANLKPEQLTFINRKIMYPVEKALIEHVLAFHKGNQSAAANTLGINRATLRTRQRRHDLL